MGLGRRNVQTKKPAKERSKKDYTPFPPPSNPARWGGAEEKLSRGGDEDVFFG